VEKIKYDWRKLKRNILGLILITVACRPVYSKEPLIIRTDSPLYLIYTYEAGHFPSCPPTDSYALITQPIYIKFGDRGFDQYGDLKILPSGEINLGMGPPDYSINDGSKITAIEFVEANGVNNRVVKCDNKLWFARLK